MNHYHPTKWVQSKRLHCSVYSEYIETSFGPAVTAAGKVMFGAILTSVWGLLFLMSQIFSERVLLIRASCCLMAFFGYPNLSSRFFRQSMTNDKKMCDFDNFSKIAVRNNLIHRKKKKNTRRGGRNKINSNKNCDYHPSPF